MSNRRNFLKTSAISICGTPFLVNSKSFFDPPINHGPLVKQPEDCEIFFVRENTPVTFHISKSADQISSVSLLSEELLPGALIPIHKHINEDEYFIFSQGTGVITIDEAMFEFKPGTTVFVPKNTWHTLRNTGDVNVIFSFGYSPAGFEDFFREIGTPKGQTFQQKPKEEFDVIAKKYGMVFK